jgi:hypothetical protein
VRQRQGVNQEVRLKARKVRYELLGHTVTSPVNDQPSHCANHIVNFPTRTLTAAELATVSRTLMNGEVTHSIPPFLPSGTSTTSLKPPPPRGATWVCDITSTADFTAVSASYTIRGIDPIVGGSQDPDDNEAMTALGNDPAGHNMAIYFSKEVRHPQHRRQSWWHYGRQRRSRHH